MEPLKGNTEELAKKWLQEAALQAHKSHCSKARCGSVIVYDGAVVGVGYNAPPLDDMQHSMCETNRSGGMPKYDMTCCMHAEWRAIFDALRNNPNKLHCSTLYFTRVGTEGRQVKSGKPYCTVCSRMALDVGIAKFVLSHKEGIFAYETGDYNQRSYKYNSKTP